MKSRLLLLLLLASAPLIVAPGCTSENPGQKDSRVVDAEGETIGGGGDGHVDDAKPDADGGTPDGAGDARIDSVIDRVDADVRSSHLVGGGATSTGGNYTLHSQLGPGINPVPMSGGNYTLRFNAALIPW